jgi:hypothetical protein
MKFAAEGTNARFLFFSSDDIFLVGFIHDRQDVVGHAITERPHLGSVHVGPRRIVGIGDKDHPCVFPDGRQHGLEVVGGAVAKRRLIGAGVHRLRGEPVHDEGLVGRHGGVLLTEQ